MNGATRRGNERFLFTVVPAVVLGTLLIVTVVGAVISSDGRGQLGGDFPSFFAAGSIVADQGYDDLYDPATQRAAQDGLVANEGGYLFFAYPPFVATGYSWLAALGYRAAYVVQMLMMGAAAVATVLLLKPMSATVRRYPVAVLALVVFFQPLLASLIGGQNTALTMMLVAAAARAEWSGKPVLAGVAVGLLAYKPQYGVPLAVVVAASGRWRVLAGTAATWGGLYVAGASVLGLGWVGPWWERATAFRDMNATVNGPLFVSWPGFIEHVSGMGGGTGRAIGLLIGAAGVGALIWMWRRPTTTIACRWALAATGLIVIAPQALFYEVGAVAVSLLLIADDHPASARLGLAVWVGGWVYLLTAPLMNTAVLLIALTMVLLFVWKSAMEVAAPGPIEVAT